jgi:hypothetical protein
LRPDPFRLGRGNEGASAWTGGSRTVAPYEPLGLVVAGARRPGDRGRKRIPPT